MPSKRPKGKIASVGPSVEKPRKDPLAIASILCPSIDKSKQKAKEDKTDTDCPQSKSYRCPADKRSYLEQEVVPILMEGMLGLAREMPQDPITFLKRFWLENQHKCDIDLPKNIL
ncbi:hypothetical protein KR018_000660 [Drosophila ironensis]|nr:hypothetical protein KR018_000660 [Drosophila ironensis]